MKLLRSGTLALATTFAVAVPAAAQANSYVLPDSTKDVVKYDNQQDNTATAVPDRTEGDILSSSVAHGKRRVRMAMRVDELTPTGDGATFYFRIGTKKKIRFLYINTSPGEWAGVKSFKKGDSNRNARCRGINWSIDYVEDIIAASVPRKCVGKPKWVHVGMAVATYEEPAAFVDDAQTDGYIGDEPKWGPRVYR